MNSGKGQEEFDGFWSVGAWYMNRRAENDSIKVALILEVSRDGANQVSDVIVERQRRQLVS